MDTGAGAPVQQPSSPARCAATPWRELEPRLFSFNSPIGACPACDGLGQSEVFDPARVVAFPSLSLASGAIKGWDRRNGYYFAMLESLAAHYEFDIEAPFESLPEQVRQRWCCTARATKPSLSATSWTAGATRASPSSSSTRSRASCPTWRGATARPTPAVVREDLARLRST